MGEVLNKEIVRMNLNGQKEEDCSDRAIYTRDMEMIEEADVIVAVCGHSRDQGYEVDCQAAKGKKVICLLKSGQKSGQIVPAMCGGNSDIELIKYNSIHQAEVLLKQIILGMG